MKRSRAITEAVVRAAHAAGTAVVVEQGAVITPSARDLAQRLGVRLERATPSSPSSPSSLSSPSSPRRVVALGADHGGFPLKEQLKKVVTDLGFEILDLGTNSTEAVDYPDFALAVANAVGKDKAWRGIMVDGAGIGSSMAANKVVGVRAALCYDLTTAANAREHNDANVLTLGGTLIGARLAADIVKAFLTTEFGGGRHQKRVDKINKLDGRH